MRSDDLATVPPDLEALATRCLQVAGRVRRALGIGMYEQVYQHALAIAFEQEGLPFEREVAIRVTYDGRDVGLGFRVDFLIERRPVLELKSTIQPHPVHETQLLTYLRGGRWPLGYILNFGTTPFYVRRKICSEFL